MLSDSFQLSSKDPIIAARERLDNLPEKKLTNSGSRKIFAKFLEDESDAASLKQAKDLLKERVLTQFPIFSLNEDYIRAITLIIMEKIERAQSLIN